MRRAFTLIELMIAIVVMALLLTALFKSSDTIRGAIADYTSRARLLVDPARDLVRLLTLDVAGAVPQTLEPLHDDRTPIRLQLKTTNSLHGNGRVWVWYAAQEGRLLRAEMTCEPNASIPGYMAEGCLAYVDPVAKEIRDIRFDTNKKTILVDIVDRRGEHSLYLLHPLARRIQRSAKAPEE